MPAETLPMAIGPEPTPMDGPFAVRTARHDDRPGGLAFLRIGATGLQVTACLTPRELRELAALCTEAATDLERPAGPRPGFTNVVSIHPLFRGRA